MENEGKGERCGVGGGGVGTGKGTGKSMCTRLSKLLFSKLPLACCGSGKWPDSGKSPRVVRRGCKRSFGTREQKSQKGLSHHQPPTPCFAPVQPSISQIWPDCAQRPFTPSPNHFGPISLNPAICQESGLQLPKTIGYTLYREAPVRFGSVTVWRWNGSSGSGSRFRRFLFKKGFSVFQYSLARKNGSGSGFGSWKTVPAVPVPLSVSGKILAPIKIKSAFPPPPPKPPPPHIKGGILWKKWVFPAERRHFSRCP